ncbi:MAG: hypothetical protein EXQ56_00395 [Acidobacteria bacterium]|nr:hypothetical protein [Acidobacteriota bacterium]
MCFATDRAEEGLEYYRQAAKIELKELWASATSTLRTMRAYVAKLRKMDRLAEAEALEKTFHRKREPQRRAGSTRRAPAASSTGKRNVPSERRHHAERRKRATRRGEDVE